MLCWYVLCVLMSFFTPNRLLTPDSFFCICHIVWRSLWCCLLNIKVGCCYYTSLNLLVLSGGIDQAPWVTWVILTDRSISYGDVSSSRKMRWKPCVPRPGNNLRNRCDTKNIRLFVYRIMSFYITLYVSVCFREILVEESNVQRVDSPVTVSIYETREMAYFWFIVTRFIIFF